MIVRLINDCDLVIAEVDCDDINEVKVTIVNWSIGVGDKIIISEE